MVKESLPAEITYSKISREWNVEDGGCSSLVSFFSSFSNEKVEKGEIWNLSEKEREIDKEGERERETGSWLFLRLVDIDELNVMYFSFRKD